MEVSFTGYKNVGGCSTVDVNSSGKKIVSHKLIMQLDNVGERDLDAFEPVLKKYSDMVKNNFLVIDLKGSLDLKTGAKSKSYYLNKQQVPVNDENLGIFSKISKLVTRIKEDGSEFKIANDYKNSEDFKMLVSGERPVSSESLDIISGKFHNRANTKEAALNICKSIDNTMRHYFNVPKY